LSPSVANSNNGPWTLKQFREGLKFKSFTLGKRNLKFEKDVRRAIPEITDRGLRGFRNQLTEMSRSSEIPGIKDTDVINFTDSSHPWSDSKLYLQRGAVGAFSQKISKKLEEFYKFYSFGSFGYEGADVHDCGHLLTGFKPDNRGEAQQVVFDMYFQHILKGLMTNETLALSLQPNSKLARLASSLISLTSDIENIMERESTLLPMPSQYRGSGKLMIKVLLDKEFKRTHKLCEQVGKVFLNQWTFPDGYDAKLVEKSQKDVRRFLEKRELLGNSEKIPFYDNLQKHWLKDEEIEDIANYAQFCALKCMANLSVLSPEEKDKTIQQVMDENGYYNMELFERSTGLATPDELKLPTYKEWCEMPHKNPDIDINYNSRMLEAILSIKANRQLPKHP
jgi:hypothetical protein